MEELRAEDLHESRVRFHLEEYQATKAEILLILRLLYEGFIWCVVTTAVAAGYVAYAATEKNLQHWPGLEWAAFGPLALVAVLGLGSLHQSLALNAYSDYLDKLDKLLAVKDHGLQSSEKLKSAKRLGAWLVGLAFLVLIAATLAFGCSVRMHLGSLPTISSA